MNSKRDKKAIQKTCILFNSNERRRKTTSLSIVTSLNAVNGTQAENYANKRQNEIIIKKKSKGKEARRKHISEKIDNLWAKTERSKCKIKENQAKLKETLKKKQRTIQYWICHIVCWFFIDLNFFYVVLTTRGEILKRIQIREYCYGKA